MRHGQRARIALAIVGALVIATSVTGCWHAPKSDDDRFEDAVTEWARGTAWESDIDSIFADPESRASAIQFGLRICKAAHDLGANTTQAASIANDGTVDIMILVGLAGAAEVAYCPETADNNWLE